MLASGRVTYRIRASTISSGFLRYASLKVCGRDKARMLWKVLRKAAEKILPSDGVAGVFGGGFGASCLWPPLVVDWKREPGLDRIAIAAGSRIALALARHTTAVETGRPDDDGRAVVVRR